jgi:hypothetical protein
MGLGPNARKDRENKEGKHKGKLSKVREGMRTEGSRKKKTPWSESASELYRPSDRRLSAK